MAGSTIDLLRRVLIDGTLAIEQAFDLTGATLREELQDFRTGLMRRLAGIGVLLMAGGLLTAAFSMLLRQLLGSWPLALLGIGGVYLVGGMILLKEPEGSMAERKSAEEIRQSLAGTRSQLQDDLNALADRLRHKLRPKNVVARHPFIVFITAALASGLLLRRPMLMGKLAGRLVGMALPLILPLIARRLSGDASSRWQSAGPASGNARSTIG